MKATIWHNPACGTSRKTLAILEETPGVDVEVIQYLKTPYSADKLRQLFRDNATYPGYGCAVNGNLAAMVANPAYVNRPFVETDKGVRFCRPQDVVREIL